MQFFTYQTVKKTNQSSRNLSDYFLKLVILCWSSHPLNKIANF